jgi:3-dehydroquinate dehydratase type I
LRHMICVSIMARDNPEALEKMARAEALADVIEIRLDVMACFDMNALVSGATRPLIITHRSRREGGKGTATHELRARHLLKAMEAGAQFVDVELSMPLDHRQQILRNHGKTQVIVSAHIRNGTPPFPELEELLRKAAATGADVVKIVTLARHMEDNLEVLRLIPLAQAMGQKIIVFCMGPLGKISRIASPLLGGFLTFASLEENEASAPGQMTCTQTKTILELLRP